MIREGERERERPRVIYEPIIPVCICWARGRAGRQPFFEPLQHHHTRLNAGPPARLETVLHSFIGLTHYFTADSGLKRLRLEKREREREGGSFSSNLLHVFSYRDINSPR